MKRLHRMRREKEGEKHKSDQVDKKNDTHVDMNKYCIQ